MTDKFPHDLSKAFSCAPRIHESITVEQGMFSCILCFGLQNCFKMNVTVEPKVCFYAFYVLSPDKNHQILSK